MFTLRCTARLWKRLKAECAAAPPVPTTRLGDWYANVVHVGRQQLVLAVCENTLLPVVVVAAPSAEIVPRIRVALGDELRAIGIAPNDIGAEIAAMSEVAYGKTANRQVLGILVDFAKALPFYLEDGASLREVSLKLAETPCSPLQKNAISPDRSTTMLFATQPTGRLRVLH